MRDDVKALVQKSRFCVLATAAGTRPYCSLMAYTADPDCRRIYMATLRSTRKFENLKANPKASLLIDSRGEENPLALTLEGCFEEIFENHEKARVQKMLLDKHPYMKQFLEHQDLALICVNVESLVFLSGLTDPYYEKIG